MYNKVGQNRTQRDRGKDREALMLQNVFFFFFPSLVMATQRVKTVGTEEGEEQRHVTGLGHNRDQG